VAGQAAGALRRAMRQRVLRVVKGKRTSILRRQMERIGVIMEMKQLSGDAQGAAAGDKKAGTASELNFANSQYYSKSEPHKELAKELKKRVTLNGRDLWQSWKSALGFLAPFGTDNSFWNRLKESSTFRHLFVFDNKSSDELLDKKALSDIIDVALKVSDVDAAVNTCALVCALLLSVPCAIMSSGSVGGKDDGWQTWLEGRRDKTPGAQCQLPFSDFCLNDLKSYFEGFFRFTLTCFYTSLFTLISCVFYYMCRPSESSNCSSLITLLEAFTLEVRYKIRKERPLQTDSTLEVPPHLPFSSTNEEMEVFMKAKFLSLNELEEQKNREFCMWFRSEKFVCLCVLCLCVCLYILYCIDIDRAIHSALPGQFRRMNVA